MMVNNTMATKRNRAHLLRKRSNLLPIHWETNLRQDAADDEETVLDEESTATRGNLGITEDHGRDPELLEDSDIEHFSQSQTVGFFEEALEQADSAEPRRGLRLRNVPQFFGEVRIHLVVTEDDYVEPKTVYVAKKGDDWDQWHRALKEEVWALQDNETWNLVRPPIDRDVISGKLVYKVKLRSSGQVDKFKERNVAKSFKQVEGLDYFDNFLPTCKPERFRTLLQLSAKQGHLMHQFDVKTVLGFPALINRERSVSWTATEFVKQG